MDEKRLYREAMDGDEEAQARLLSHLSRTLGVSTGLKGTAREDELWIRETALRLFVTLDEHSRRYMPEAMEDCVHNAVMLAALARKGVRTGVDDALSEHIAHEESEDDDGS